jgi:RimJ/RimL family protein N-acetyltransferase
VASFHLQTDRLILREWRESDREPFARMNADPRVMEFYPATLTRDQSDRMVERIQSEIGERGFGYWALELRESGAFVGYTGIRWVEWVMHFTPAVEVGWRVAPEYWGSGFATEAARAAVRDGFERAGIEEIVAMASARNVRSTRVMEKLGMTHDPRDDFDHPMVESGHRLSRHVLYRLRRERAQVHADKTVFPVS